MSVGKAHASLVTLYEVMQSLAKISASGGLDVLDHDELIVLLEYFAQHVGDDIHRIADVLESEL